jgi:hypothetical protein
MHDRERKPGRVERLYGETEDQSGVFATREEEHRTLRLGHSLTDDVNRLGFERPHMI